MSVVNSSEKVALAPDLVEHFPHGITVFDGSGRLVGANKASVQFLGLLLRKLPGQSPRCCELFGCRIPGVLEDACLAELVREARRPLPDIRMDLPAPAPTPAVWLTTAPFLGENDRFVVELRLADQGDRRRRTQPHWMGAASLRVFALGRTRVESRGESLTGKWLDQRAGQLLKYLICERRRVVYPEEIAAAIWPHDDPHAPGAVRYVVHQLRRQLEPVAPHHGPSSFVIAVEGGYRLSSAVKVDADEFERHAVAGLEARSRGEEGQAEMHFGQAAALYGGDLLADRPHVPWVFEERERLRSLAKQSLGELVRHELGRDELGRAIGLCRRLVQLEPYDLHLQRGLLTLYLTCGRRDEAMSRYRALRASLRDEFGEELDFTLADLASPAAAQAIRHPDAWLTAGSGYPT